MTVPPDAGVPPPDESDPTVPRRSTSRSGGGPRPDPSTSSNDGGGRDDQTVPRRGASSRRPPARPSGRTGPITGGEIAESGEMTQPRRPTGRSGRHAPGESRPAATSSRRSAPAHHAETETHRHREVAVGAPTASTAVSGFARYQFGDELGRGGLGVVRAAEDISLRREVAIKTLLRPRGSELAAFIEEAQITGQLEHPNIVPLHELGYDPDGRPYIAMKRVMGHTLRGEIIRSHRRRHATDAEVVADEQRLLDVFLKICDAVGYAHSRGVVHRDLKPDNVMVGEFGEVLVMDWGLARPMGGRPSGVGEGGADVAPGRTASGTVVPPSMRGSASGRMVSSSRRESRADGSSADLTVEGEVFGTPAYMPPEQADGRVADIGPTTDIYSLGGILYAILTGEAPFTGSNAAAILDDVRNGRLVPPSERGGNRRVPRELEAAVMRAMAFDPADRYPSAADLRDDIQRYLAGRTLAAADYTSWQLLWKWVGRHKVAVAGGMSTAAAIIIGLLAVIVSRAEARQAELDKQRQSAIAFVESAHGAFETAEAVPWNPASPQDYYGAWLPPMLLLGRAIQTHPDPPEEWRTELASHCQALQDHAGEIGDWGMALHMAASAEAWGAISEAEGAQRVTAVRDLRNHKAANDRDRLQAVLERIRELETPPDEGTFTGQEDSRYVPREFEERAMRIAIKVRKDTAPMTRTVLQLLDNDPGTCESFGIEQPSWLQRHFLVELAGRLRDTHTEVNGRTCADIAVRQITRTDIPAIDAEEVGWWIGAATRLDGDQSRPISTRLGRDLESFIRARLYAHPHISIAVAADLHLPMVEVTTGEVPELSDTVRGQRVQECMAEWLIFSASSGSDFTREMLDGATKPGTTRRELRLLLELLGRWGDDRPPDVTRPDFCAPVLARRVLRDTPIDALATMGAEGDYRFEEAVACVEALSRLGAKEAWPDIFERLLLAGRGGPFFRRCTTAALLCPIPESCEDPRTASEFIRHSMYATLHGDPQRAHADLSQAIQLEPENYRPWAHRAAAAAELGAAPVQSLSDADRAVALGPDIPWVWLTRGGLHADAGNVAEAIADYERAIEVATQNTAEARSALPAAYNNLGALLNENGQSARALECFNRAVELAPRMPEVLFSRGAFYMQNDDPGNAAIDLSRAHKYAPRYGKALCAAGQALTALGDNGNGLARVALAVWSDPANPLFWTIRGDIHQHRRDREAALADYTRALALNPRFTMPRNNRALVYRTLGRLEEALADFSWIVEHEPFRWRAWAGRGQVAARLGKTVLAAACFDRALEIAPPEVQQALRKMKRDEGLGD